MIVYGFIVLPDTVQEQTVTQEFEKEVVIIHPDFGEITLVLTDIDMFEGDAPDVDSP